MSRPTFWEGLALAVVLAVLGSIGMAVLPMAIGKANALAAVATVLAAIYIGYLMKRSGERAGRIVLPTAALVISIVSWQLLSVPAFLLLLVGTIWLVRALYHHSGVLAAGMDLGVSALACGGAIWALGTGSYALTFWCFFLIQALFVWIPELGNSTSRDGDLNQPDFDNARSLAAAALKRLAATR